jgi:hypothetical protein
MVAFYDVYQNSIGIWIVIFVPDTHISIYLCVIDKDKIERTEMNNIKIENKHFNLANHYGTTIVFESIL